MRYGRAGKLKMMDVPQDGFVRFHLTDSSDELMPLIRGELSFLKARGVEKKWKTTIRKSYTCTPTANLSSIHEEIKKQGLIKELLSRA